MERAQLISLVLATGYVVKQNDLVFLRDPKWGPAEQAQFATACRATDAVDLVGDGWLCVPTGGTSGVLRFARHDERTLSAAVRGFCGHFGVRRVNAVDVLPAHHVSGLMARIRCEDTRGVHIEWSWKQLENGQWPELPTTDDGWFLSLVPTQLQRLLASEIAVANLRMFRLVFIGGGPLWPGLAEAAALAGVPLAICYGMTETAAMVAAQKPGEFAAGDRSCGLPMSHVQVEMVDEVSGKALPVGAPGLVRITGQAICRGYWPELNAGQSLLTEDLGRFDAQGRLHLLGRRDAVIITGGEKVSPLEVEAVLRTSDEFDDVAVLGLPDVKWGQVVVACYSPRVEIMDTRKIAAVLEMLAFYKRPKHFLAISPWPRNAQGKLNRTALLAAAVTALASLDPGEQGGR